MSNKFKYNNLGTCLEITIDDDDDGQVECPKCKCKFKQLLQHLKKNTECRAVIENFENFRNEYKLFCNRRSQFKNRMKKLKANAEETHRVEAAKIKKHRQRKLESNPDETHIIEAARKIKQRESKLLRNAEETHAVEAAKMQRHRETKLESNPEETHKVEAAKVRKQRERKLESNPEETHTVEAAKIRKQRKRKLEGNSEELHRVENRKKKTQREEKMDKNADKLHIIEAKMQRNHRAKSRNNRSQNERLRNFRRAVLFGPIFVCSCCHVKHYESNVNKVDDNLEGKLLEKYPDCYLECVREFVKVEINEDKNYYLCKTCITYMKSSKIPPMSVCNGLDIIKSNDPELQLSELENNLIALRIMFQKIYYLPKSRWTGL